MALHNNPYHFSFRFSEQVIVNGGASKDRLSCSFDGPPGDTSINDNDNNNSLPQPSSYESCLPLMPNILKVRQ